MLMQVGGEGRPTFFEMAAAQTLPASLRAALLYALGVMAQRRPILHTVLDYSDEAFAALMLMLELHTLNTSDGSFSEALYGLRRAPSSVTTSASPPDDASSSSSARLTRRHRLQSLAFLVLLPYATSKMQAAYKAHHAAALQAALWAPGDDDTTTTAAASEEEDSPSPPQAFGRPHAASSSWRHRARAWWTRLLAWCYPWAVAGGEGVAFAYQLLYLLEVTPYYTPGLHLTGLVVRRTTGQESVALAHAAAASRARHLARAVPAPLRPLARAGYALLDHAHTALIGTVFLFKMMEWWYQSAEQRVAAPAIYPPPPPPPPPKVAPDGVGLPTDRRVCPLCAQRRTNPAMVAASGFVFCYPCAFRYVTQYRRCPVTLVPAEVDQIRRLYYGS